MIALTGATGFLGSHLLAALLTRGEKIVVLKRSFSNTYRINQFLPHVEKLDLDTEPAKLNAIFQTARISTVIHCATDYGRRNTEPYQIAEANIVLPLHLLHLAKKYGTRCFINTDTILDKRINHYSLSKNQFIQWLEFYSANLACINLALEHFYGAGDDPTKFTSYIINALLQGIPFIDLTYGEQTRHFVHVDDVVAAFLCLLDHAERLGNGLFQYQVGALAPLSIHDFVLRAKTLTENHDTELRFGALPYRDNEVMHPVVDLTPLSALGWSPQISLDDGLARTIRAEQKLKNTIESGQP